MQNAQKKETHSKITNARTGNSHPKRREQSKTNQRMVHTENNFKRKIKRQQRNFFQREIAASKNESLPTERSHKKCQIKIQKGEFPNQKNEVKKNVPKEVTKKEIQKKAKETKKR